VENITKYEALIADLAHTLYRKTHLYDFEDLFQIGLQSAVRLQKSFNPEKSQLSTFYTLCVRRDMVKFIKRHNRLFADVPQYKDSPVSLSNEVWESLPDLDPEDTEMVRMLVAGHSKREIAKRLCLPMPELQARLNKIGESIA